MIGFLMDFLSAPSAKADAGDRIRLAAAALLVEAATMDGRMDDAERARILSVTKAHFGLSDAQAEDLLMEAQRAVAESVQLFGFTSIVKESFDEAERVRLIEMLWEVAYADRQLHDYEASLVRRIAGLLFVSDQDSGAARKRALLRLGLGEGLA